MIRKMKRFFNKFCQDKFLFSYIEGDGIEYEIIENAVKKIKNPIGCSLEIGVRRGHGSRTIIESYRKFHTDTNLIHIGLDPYGELPYNFSEDSKNQKADYTNKMKRVTQYHFAKKYPEFHLVNLDTYEFFKRFNDGYPIYYKRKKIIDKFEIVHFDGLHDLQNVTSEVNFFLNHLSKHTIFIFDNINCFDIKFIQELLEKKNFKVLEIGSHKMSFEYII
jgi:hypothetical protein